MPTRIPLAAAVLLAGACKSGRIEGDGGDDSATPTLKILSPEPGAEYQAGDIVLLSARARDVDGNTLVIEAATWAVGDWNVAGNDVSVDDLPEGDLDLQLSAVVNGQTLSSSVAFTVAEEVVVDPGEDIDYEGIIAAHVYYAGAYGQFDDPCDGWMAFTLFTDDTMSGVGSCRAFGEDWEFAVEGTRAEGTVSGDLSMSFEKATIPTQFTGTIDAKDHVEGAFSEEFVPAEGEWLKVEGTFSADPTSG